MKTPCKIFKLIAIDQFRIQISLHQQYIEESNRFTNFHSIQKSG